MWVGWVEISGMVFWLWCKMLENLLMDFRFAELVDDEDETVVSASS